MTKKTQRAKARAERKPRLGEEHTRPDGSVIRYVREEDDDQKPVDHYRTVDTLALMLLVVVSSVAKQAEARTANPMPARLWCAAFFTGCDQPAIPTQG